LLFNILKRVLVVIKKFSMVFVKTLAKKLLVLAIIFKLLFYFFGYECTMFWLQAFTSFCLNQILSLFGSRLDFSETPPLLQWELISFSEFLRHLKQTCICLSEVNSFEDLVTLEKTLDFGMVYAPTKAGTIIILFLSLHGFSAWLGPKFRVNIQE
jgi:hypothetical protein